MAEASVALEAIRPLLQLYYQALSGESPLLAAQDDRSSRRYPETRGTIRLPSRERPAWYRVALAHRSLHQDCGTFRFRLAGPAALFRTLRPDPRSLARDESESDLEVFFRLFADRRLAIACFTVLEDLRLDTTLPWRYPGLAGDLRDIQQQELAARPSIETLTPRHALLELLVRASLGWRGGLSLPARLAPTARELSAVAARLRHVEANVEDSAEAATRAYAHLARIPNLLDEASRRPVVEIDGAGEPREVRIRLPEAPRPRLEGDAVLDVPLVPVGYRDALEARYTERAPLGPMDQEAIFRLRGPGGVPAGADQGHARDAPLAAGGDATLSTEPFPHEHAEPELDEAPPPELGALEPDAPGSFLYPEWDHRVGRYRERWCRVREAFGARTGSTRLYRETLREHGELVADIRRQFERLPPETLRRVRAARDGDDLDFDACVDALADLRAGLVPSDKVYMSRERAQRDVAVVFLVDLSSSTAERLDQPARRGQRYRRILDVERESLVLLIEALVRVGDAFGMYGFSGSGRGDVRCVVIKDLHEPLTGNAIARLDALKPMHTTRMGAAIRHALTKLRHHAAGTRLLVVVSDGRPFDIDYGQEYGEGAEVAYAINDTRASLDEARAQGVRPFLLTVDQAGEDYLRPMCRGLDYEVLADVTQLPARLLALYRRLAARA